MAARGHLAFLVPAPGATPRVHLHANFLREREKTSYTKTFETVSRPEIAAGNVVVEAEVQFNRVNGDAETDARFGLVVRAYAGNPSTFHDQWRNGAYLAQEAVGLIHDQPGSWVRKAVEMTLPAETGFVLVWLAAAEDVVNDGEAPEFDGHFADAASLIVREP